MKKKFALFLAIVMTASAMLSGITALASDIEVIRSQIPKADMVNLQFNADGTVTNDVAESPWTQTKVNEYGSGTSGASASFTRVKPVEVTVFGQKYTTMGFVKDAATNTIGIDMSAFKSSLTGQLSAGFTLEAAFTVPAKKSSSTAIIGATSGGGFGIFQKADGVLLFEVGDSAGGYKDLIFTDTFNEGDHVHVVCVFSGSKLVAYANGVKQGELAISGFRAGGYFGAIGLGGSTASATNYTNFACNSNKYTEFKLYSKAFTEKQAAVAFASYLNTLEPVAPEKADVFPDANIIDITFDENGVVSAGDNILGAPVIKEWASNNNPKAAVANVKKITFEKDGVTFGTYGFVKESTTNVLTADMSANKAGLTGALSDGFTLETSFIMPAVNTSSSSAIIGATSGGGLGIFLKTNGKLLFEVGKQDSGYADLELPTVFSEGDYVHLVCVYDGAKLVAYANGVKQGELAMAGFRAGGYHGMFGMGATIASLTNPTNYPANTGCAITSLKVYDDPMSEASALLAYQLNAAAMTTESITYTDAASIVDVEFGTGTAKDISPASVVGNPVITNYSSSGNVATTSNYKDVTVNYGGNTYTVSGFAKTSATSTMMLDFSAVSAKYSAAITDGFTLETAFNMPADRGTSGATTWGSNNGHAIIGATSGGGYVLGRTRDGKLFWSVHNGSSYVGITTADVYETGEYIHAVAEYDKTEGCIKLWINNTLVGTQTIAKANLGSGLPSKYVGIGGSLSSATNPTNFACDKSLTLTSFKLYDEVLTSDQVTAAYAKNLIKLGAMADPDKMVGDIVDLKFGTGTVKDISPASVVGTPVVTNYSSSGNVAATSNYNNVTVNYGGNNYTVSGFAKGSATHTIMLDFSAVSANYVAAMSDGFTLETSFNMPADRGTSGATSWGTCNGHAIIGATSGGGFVLGRTRDGKLFWCIKDSSAYINVCSADTYETGEYIHAVAEFDKTNLTIKFYINGELIGTTPVNTGLSWGSLPKSYMGIGGSLGSATNPTNFACDKSFALTTFKIYNDVLTEDQIDLAYAKNLYDLGAAVGYEFGKGLPVNAVSSSAVIDPPVIPEPPETTQGDDILALILGKDNQLFASEFSIGEPVIAEYSGSGSKKSGFPGVQPVTISIDGQSFTAAGFKTSATSNQIGIDLSKYKTDLNAELADGFSVESSFVIPSISDTSEHYFVGATNAGGFGICAQNGNLVFYVHDGAWKSVSTPLPAAGTYCHVVGTYDSTSKEISFMVNGIEVGKTSVAKFNPGGWYGAIGLGGSTSSVTNYTKCPVPAGTIITGLHIYSDALTSDEAYALYEADMAKYGFEINTRVYDDEFEPVLRFMVTSDVHISSNGDARCGKVANAIGDVYNIASTAGNHYDKVDAIAVVGDIADNGKKEQLEWFKAICDAGIDYDETQLIMQTGNHDYYDGNSKSEYPRQKEEQFNDVFAYTGEKLADGVSLKSTYRGIYNSHYVVNGYHFISLTPGNQGWHYNNDDIQWLDKQLAAAAADTGADKPIFVFHHVGNMDTILGTDAEATDSGVKELESTLAKYPQVVDFSGHSHKPVNDECSIYQGKYTALGTGTLNYTSTVSYDGSKIPMTDKSIYDISQVYVIEVDANSRTRIRVYDINQDKFVGETYLLDSYKPADFKYNESRFTESDIFFANDAKVEVTKATQNLVTFKFNVTSPDGYPASVFHAVVEDESGSVVKDRYVAWAYYDEDYSTVLSTAIGGLKPDTDYKLKIYGLNTLYLARVSSDALVSENWLETSFHTTPEATGTPVADILDVSLNTDGTVTDISGNNMTATVSGAPVIAYDETIGMNAITFAANSQHVKMADYSEEADSMSYSFAVEGYFKVNEYNCESGSKGPMGSEQTGGFGWDMNDQGQVTYSVYTGGYKTIAKTQEVGKYYHWIGSYDGEYLTVYVNGHKIGKLSAAAPMTYNSVAAQCFYLGADTTGAGNAERQSRVSIALARIYSLPISDAQAEELWEAVAAKQDPSVYVNDSDDPEYKFWENVDDFDSEITFVTPDGKHTHNHENDSSIKTDDFAEGSVGYFSGNHLFKGKCHYITNDMQCKLTFTGTDFRYVLYYRGPVADQYGTGVDVYVDGQLYTTVTGINGNNLTSRYVALEVNDLADKKHEITFVSHDGNRVIMDCFDVVRGTGADEDGKPIPQVPYWTYVDANETDYVAYYTPAGEYCNLDYLNTDGQVDATETWQFFNGSHLQNHTGIFGNYVQGAAAALTFNGTGIRMVTQYRGTNTADIDIYIDGKKVDTVKGLSAADDTSNFVIYENDSLKDGKHTFMAIAANGGQMPIDYFQIQGTPVKAERKNITLPGTTPGNELTQLYDLESTQDRNFVAFEPTDSDGYAAYYMRAKLEAGKTYTVTFRAISNKQGISIMTDLEGQGGISESSVQVTETDKWVDYTVTLTPKTSYSDFSDKDTREMGFPLRVYINQKGEAQVFVDDIKVAGPDGSIMISQNFDKADIAGVNSWYAGRAAHVPDGDTPEEKKTNLYDLKETQERQFVAFEPTATDGYAAYYMRSKLEANKTYTVSFRAISNTKGIVIMTDLEGQGGISESAVTVNETDKWVDYTVTITPKTSYSDSSDKDTREMGFPLRVYINQKGEAQVFVDDIKVTGPDGKTVLSQNFDESGIDGVVTWYSGRATYIPEGYEAEKEDEVLGYNEIINGDFEDESLMDYWWSRDDWNGGTWKRVAGKGYNGTAGLMATGKGDGSNTYNAGIFYNLCGEGVEDSLVLEAGKTYVLKYKVFRPEGVDAYTYIDINEGQVATAAASQNGVWETVSVRFVAPEGALKIRLVANGLKDGQHVYVDDIELRQVGGDPDGEPMTKYIKNTGKTPHALDVTVNVTESTPKDIGAPENTEVIAEELPAPEDDTCKICGICSAPGGVCAFIWSSGALGAGCGAAAVVFGVKKAKSKK